MSIKQLWSFLLQVALLFLIGWMITLTIVVTGKADDDEMGNLYDRIGALEQSSYHQ